MQVDVKHTNDGDIDLSAGDIMYDASTDQHKKDIVLADKGHYKESPQTGVGLVDFLNDENPENMLRTIRKECGSDGMKVDKVAIITSGIQILAEYEDDKR